MKRKKLYIVVNVDWFFLSHRLPIAIAAKERGYDVTLFAIEEAGKGDEIRNYGFKFIPIPTSRSGTNIINEFKVLLFLLKHYATGKPDVIHHVAVKPVTYGSVAARLSRAPKVVNALSGLGFLFINSESNRLVHWIVGRLFQFGFKNPKLTFILQNRDDVNEIRKLDLVEDFQIKLIKGSGVDLSDYVFTAEPVGSKLKIVLSGRMLWDKGVGEFVEAARILNEKYRESVEFILVGGVDSGNRSEIKEAQLLDWNDEGNVKWIGFREDMISLLVSSNIIVLPSYREGLPKSLIEACAIGRAIVTTDVPGCREVVKDGVNGLLVEVKNARDLADKIEVLIKDDSLRRSMGEAGRKIAEKEFSIEDVVNKTLDIYAN